MPKPTTLPIAAQFTAAPVEVEPVVILLAMVTPLIGAASKPLLALAVSAIEVFEAAAITVVIAASLSVIEGSFP